MVAPPSHLRDNDIPLVRKKSHATIRLKPSTLVTRVTAGVIQFAWSDILTNPDESYAEQYKGLHSSLFSVHNLGDMSGFTNTAAEVYQLEWEQRR